MKMVKVALLGGALLSVSGAAAQPGADGPPRDETRADAIARADGLFARLDANRDGRVTGDEVRGAMGPGGDGPGAGGPGAGGPPPGGPGMGGPGMGGPNLGGLFDRLDTDRNGSLSREEFAQMGAMRRGGGMSGPGMRGPGAGGGLGGGEMLARMIGPEGLTRDAFRARMLERFDRLDLNRDGRVTGEERQQARSQRREMRTMAPPAGPQPQEDQ